MAAYCARCEIQGVVLIPAGQIAYGKLSQALDYGALTLQIDGNFDTTMRLVQELTSETEPVPSQLDQPVSAGGTENGHARAF